MRIVAVRLKKGEDLRKAIENIVQVEGLKASVIVNAVGSLSKACLRMAGAQSTNDGVAEFEGPFEIVSLMGIPQDTMHMHLSISQNNGSVIGGHMKYGNIIETTVELVLLEDETQLFRRSFDPQTGFDELVIEKSS